MKQSTSHHLPGIFDVETTVKNNHLYYGDNLTIMRNMPIACVDLIYLDPPFNSQRNYNLIYKKLTGQPVPEQEEAFCDAWEMDAEKEDMVRNMPVAFEEYGADKELIQFWQTWIQALRHTQPRLLAYLVYMSYRLFEMRRILKPTGSIYLHCDPTASHYIKVIMDGIFGHQFFRNEVVWKRSYGHGDSRRSMGRAHDILLVYSKGSDYTLNRFYHEHSQEYIDSFFRHEDARGIYKLENLTSPNPRPNLTYPYKGYPPPDKGWRVSLEKMQELDADNRLHFPAKKDGRIMRKVYLNELEGQPMTDVWTDIHPLSAHDKERLGYPTQKPIALLERIICASSNEGDVVFDPFAGCGTAIYAAHQLGRKWIGCDIAILSVQIVRDVLLKRYGLKEGEHYQIDGVPLSVEGAEDLFLRDPHQFQHWAIELAGGFSSTKLSGDMGIDGRIHFESQDGLKNMVISVKGGKQLTPAFIRELRGVLERESSSEMGGLICLHEPTKGMLSEAASAGIYHYQGTNYDRLQIRTIQELLEGKGFHTPSRVQTLNWVKQLPLPL